MTEKSKTDNSTREFEEKHLPPSAVKTPLKTKEENEEELTSVGIDSLIKASEKLMNINRGLIPADERDSLVFKQVLNTDDLIAERIKLDAGKLRNSIMFKLSKTRNLQNFPSNVFNDYGIGHIISNPLSLPSEEINPMALLEQMARVTLFGPGGVSSPDAISTEAQNVHPSQFGFVDPIATSESSKAGADLRMASETRINNKGEFLTKVRERKTGKLVWLTPEELNNSVVAFTDK